MARKIALHKGLSRKEVATVAKETLVSRGVKPPEPGERMSDGTVYAGKSPDTRKPMFTTTTDVPQLLDFRGAEAYAEGLDEHGHQDWRLPTQDELNRLFQNRQAIGGFGSGEYWCSTPFGKAGLAGWAVNFSDGKKKGVMQDHALSVRCVR